VLGGGKDGGVEGDAEVTEKSGFREKGHGREAVVVCCEDGVRLDGVYGMEGQEGTEKEEDRGCV